MSDDDDLTAEQTIEAIHKMTQALTLALEDDMMEAFAALSYPERNPAIARRRARKASRRPLGQCRGDWYQLPRWERRQIVMERYHQRMPSSAASISDALAATSTAWDACDPSLLLDVDPSPIVFARTLSALAD